MKKIILKYLTFLLLVTVIFLVTKYPVLAATTTSSPTSALKITGTPTPSAKTTPTAAPENQALLQQIDTLKEKVASKVASLHLVEKRGIIGTITGIDTTNNLITINDVQNNTQFIDVDEITTFADINGKTIGLSDLQKGTMISTLGLYNKDSQHLLARFINIVSNPIYLSGEVTSINKTAGTFYITSADNKTHNIDVEVFTKTYTVSSSSDLTKVGFSKIDIGDRVIIIGAPDKTDSTLTVASRIMQFPNVAKIPNLNIGVSPTAATPTAAVKPSK